MTDYQRIAQAIEIISQTAQRQPSLGELAASLELSPYHFQRLFQRWAGVTPKKFLQLLTSATARQCLLRGASVLDASYEAGLSGPGRLHDLTVALEAASPGEIKSGGRGWTIQFGYADSPFGTCRIAQSPRGILALSFLDKCDEQVACEELATDWPHAELVRNDETAAQLSRDIFAGPTKNNDRRRELRCYVKATRFQFLVWRALLQIPAGQLASYGAIAQAIGSPTAVRAVGSAVGANPIANLIPCHRVIRSTGVVGEYRWGKTRKRALIARELAAVAEV